MRVAMRLADPVMTGSMPVPLLVDLSPVQVRLADPITDTKGRNQTTSANLYNLSRLGIIMRIRMGSAMHASPM